MQGLELSIAMGKDAQAHHAEEIDGHLKRLAKIVRKRRRFSTGLKVAYAAIIVAMFAGAGIVITELILHRNFTVVLLILPILVCSFVLILGLLLFNIPFYPRYATLLQETIVPLAQAGEERTVGPLLDLMDPQMGGGIGWGKLRPLFHDTISLLFARLTPEGFDLLSDTQIKQMMPLIRTEPVRTSMRDMLVRCGDARALKGLRREAALSTQALKNRKRGYTAWIDLRIEEAGGKPVEQSNVDFLTDCCNAIQARLHEETRTAQLLRASHRSDATEPSHLLRPTFPATSTVMLHEALRATENPAEQEDAIVVVADPGRTHPLSPQEAAKSVSNQTRL